jgi:hypothetical protein
MATENETKREPEDANDRDGFSPLEQGLIRCEPFCACGRIVSRCDGSRRGCGKSAKAEG